jgi:hypothetical protein
LMSMMFFGLGGFISGMGVAKIHGLWVGLLIGLNSDKKMGKNSVSNRSRKWKELQNQIDDS